MRRYEIVVNDVQHTIDVEETSANTFQVMVGGRLIDVRLDAQVDIAGSVPTPALAARPTPRAAPAVAAPPPAAPAPIGGPARDVLTAPMPGVILSVDVAVGQHVAQGDPIAVLEAMKMKNALRAPRTGRVAEVYVAAGAQVKYAAPLVRIEDEA